MNEIKLIDLQEIALPNWLPNNYVQAVADAIESTGFVPPIIVLNDELLTPDVVAALVTIKARGKIVPLGVAVMESKWLVKVDRRTSKTKIEQRNHDDWHRYIRPTVTYRDAFWTYNTSGGTGSGNMLRLDKPGYSMSLNSWNPEQPTLTSFTLDPDKVKTITS